MIREPYIPEFLDDDQIMEKLEQAGQDNFEGRLARTWLRLGLKHGTVSAHMVPAAIRTGRAARERTLQGVHA